MKVNKDTLALPMLNLLGSMAGNNTPLYLPLWGLSGVASENTNNYAVDLPAGIYTVRDILNLCCVANHAITFNLVFTPFNLSETDKLGCGIKYVVCRVARQRLFKPDRAGVV